MEALGGMFHNRWEASENFSTSSEKVVSRHKYLPTSQLPWIVFVSYKWHYILIWRILYI